MNKVIRQHHDSDDIQKLFIDTDLHLWSEETAIISNEVKLFWGLLSARLIELSKERYVSFSELFDEVEYFANANIDFIEKLAAYKLQLEGLKECEDLQCETHFLNGHSTFRQNIQQYLARYRQLKNALFDALGIGKQDQLTTSI